MNEQMNIQQEEPQTEEPSDLYNTYPFEEDIVTPPPSEIKLRKPKKKITVEEEDDVTEYRERIKLPTRDYSQDLSYITKAKTKQEFIDRVDVSSLLSPDEKDYMKRLYNEGETRPVLTSEVTRMFEGKKRRTFAEDDETTIEGGSLMKRLKKNKKAKGKGKKTKKVIFGCGKTINPPKIRKGCRHFEYDNPDNISIPNNPFIYIEMSKLKNNNVLSLKYKSTRNHHPKFIQQRISQNLSDIIQDILNKNLDERLLKTLNEKEKTILNQFLTICKIKDIVLNRDELEEFNKNFDILLGEISAGNDNPQIKAKLKEYLHTGMKLGRISKSEGFEILLKL
jgi:hypothetical protein